MEELVQHDKLHTRIRLWADEEVATGGLPRRAGTILEAILYRGELPRGEVPDLLGASERTARRAVSALVAQGVVTAKTTKSPLRIGFPARLASRWMPGLFPEQRA